MRRPIILITTMVVAGVILEKLAPVPLSASLAAAIAGLVLFPLGRLRIRALEYAAISLLLLSIGMLLQLRGEPPLQSHGDGAAARLARTWQGSATGIVADEPELRPVLRAAMTDMVETEEMQTRFPVQVLGQNGAVTPWLVTVYLPGGADVQYGDLLKLQGRFFLFPEDRNPGQIDYREYLSRKRIIAGLAVPDPAAMTSLSAGRGNPLKAVLLKAKAAVRRAFSRTLGEDDQSLAGALILGDRAGVRGRLEDDFVQSGTAHILSVSGFHIAVVGLFAWAILRLLRVGITAESAAVCLVCLAYSALTGFAPPSLRAAVMICCWRGATMLRRQADGPTTLAVALLIVLGALGGNELFSPGLQLSFAAVAGIVLISHRFELLLGGGPLEPWEALLPRTFWEKAAGWLISQLRTGIAISAAAWIATAPILAYHFHIVTPSALVGNLFVVPAAGALIPLALLGGLAGAVSPPAGALLILAKPFFWLLQKLVWLFARMPGGHFYVIGPSVAWALIFFAMLAIGVCRRRLRIAPGPIAACSLILANVYLWQGALPRQKSALECTVLDVGQGLASCALLPEGQAILFDAGSRSIPAAGERVIAPFLWTRRVRSLDLIVISHAHSDHANAVAALIERIPVRAIAVPIDFERSPAGQELLRLFEKKRIRVLRLGAGDELRVGTASLRALNPPKDPKLLPLLDENERSLVVELLPFGPEPCGELRTVEPLTAEGHEQGSLLFTGDAESYAIGRLTRQAPRGRWDVVILPHHGLNEEAAVSFAQAAAPALALASYDRRPPILDALGLPALDTSSCGAITVTWREGVLDVRGHVSGEEAFPPSLGERRSLSGGAPRGPLIENPPAPGTM